MTPELSVFLVSASGMTLAYTVLYPRLAQKSLNRMMALDLALSAALLIVVGMVYYGSGTGFSLLLFSVPWWAFTLICAAVVEVPLFIWFCKRWNIDLFPPPE